MARGPPSGWTAGIGLAPRGHGADTGLYRGSRGEPLWMRLVVPIHVFVASVFVRHSERAHRLCQSGTKAIHQRSKAWRIDAKKAVERMFCIQSRVASMSVRACLGAFGVLRALLTAPAVNNLTVELPAFRPRFLCTACGGWRENWLECMPRGRGETATNSPDVVS